MLSYGLAWRISTDNQGDDLLTLAAMQHLPRIDHLLDADALDEPIATLKDDDRVVTLVPGLMLRTSANWPPEEHVAPVCMGVHISGEDACGLALSSMDGAGLRALEACAPVSCRDKRTQRRLEALGVPTLLTGCLTLTLSHPPMPRSGVVCCDMPESAVQLLKSCRSDVTEVTHQMDDPDPDFTRRMDAARSLLTTYASAEMVFTRRLHCAMACLAVGTPVRLLYHAEYEDVTRFAPMDSMVHTQPLTEFMEEVKRKGVPEARRNPADMDAVRQTLTNALHAAMERAQHMPLPVTPADEAALWRAARMRCMLSSAAARIQKLENQHYEDLHAKFSLILKEDSAKAVLTELLNLPEVQEGLKAAAMRRQMEKLTPREQKALRAQYRHGQPPAEDLLQKAREAIRQLGWPEGADPEA